MGCRWVSGLIESQKIPPTHPNKRGKRSGRASGDRCCLVAFYGPKSRNQAIFGDFHGGSPTEWGANEATGRVNLEKFYQPISKERGKSSGGAGGKDISR